MDSNSGSLQSSSGGDEEFDSRAESLSAFLNPSSNSSSHVVVGGGGGGMSSTRHPPNPYHHQTLNQSTLYDPLSSYLDVFTHSTPQTPMLNLDTVWAPRGGLRSEPNSTQPGSLTGLLSSSSSLQQPSGQPQFHKPLPSSGNETASRPPGSSDQANVARNPKKRSRASRRAPTTVLTTDTSNFRAMVQEFTGIPAPPFSASPFPRTRLDLFSNASNLRSSFDPSPPPPNQPFILRPFAHKVQPPLFVSSTIAPTTSSIVTNSNTTLPCTSNFSTSASNSNSTTNYQLTPELGLPRQSQTLLSMQNPMSSTFQSLIQSPPPKYPSPNLTIFGTKSQTLDHIPSSDPSTIKGGILEDFGMSHGNLGTLSNLVTTGGLSLRSNNDNWGEGVGHNEGEQTHLRPFNGNYGSNNPQRVVSSNTSGCKMNFSATTTSDFHGEKTTENVVSTRGEGMVDSWICSSD